MLEQIQNSYYSFFTQSTIDTWEPGFLKKTARQLKIKIRSHHMLPEDGDRETHATKVFSWLQTADGD